MAYQHFYSRVPSKMSMFNKADGFDTFARSNELSREFIEKELAVVCDNKPTPAEAVLIRKGELPPVYFQLLCKSSELIQSCVSYIPSDYTGERSAYLVHNLVFTEAEKNELICNTNDDLLNPDMFDTDIAPFDIASQESKPDTDYPVKEYVRKKAESTQWITETYDIPTVKRFIFAVLCTICGKPKSVFYVIPENENSETTLRFFNSFMQIIPFHLRPELSFVSRVNDTSRYGGFKLKCVTEDCGDIPLSRGVTFNFRSKLVVGVKDEEVAANGQVVEFFYSMLGNDVIRREFLLFVNHAVGAVPTLAALNMKTIDNLVFLFKCSCGLFEEKVVLPNDDKVYAFFAAYEKVRAALTDEYRINAMKCLNRYPENHIAIPKNVFSKISKLYPGEVPGVKRIIMSVVRDLIHTDIMRDKLFAFMAANYTNEDIETRDLITKDLSRVFYGGFLQQQILTFFADNFASETPETQDAVIDKLLLSIRTKSIMPMIIEFFRKFYDVLSEESRDKLYEAIVEHLPEGDELSRELLRIATDFSGNASEELKADFSQKLCDAVESEQKKRTHPLIAMLSTERGYYADIVTAKIFSEWAGRKIFTEYVQSLYSGSVQESIGNVASVWEAFPDMPDDAAAKLIACLSEAFATKQFKADFYTLLDAEKQIHDRLTAIHNPNADKFAEAFSDKIIHPLIGGSLHDVFLRKDKTDAIEQISDYAKVNPAIKECEQYKTVLTYIEMKKAAVEQYTKGIFICCDRLPDIKALRQAIASYMLIDFIDSDVLDGKDLDLSRAAIFMLSGYLKSNVLDFRTAYAKTVEVLSQRMPDKALKGKVAEQAAFKNDSLAIAIILYLGNIIEQTDSLSIQMTEAPYNEKSGLTEMLAEFAQKHGKNGSKHISSCLEKLTPANSRFVTYCKNAVKSIRPESTGLFSKLFGKKK